MATKDLFWYILLAALLFRNRKTFNSHTEPYKHSNTMQSEVVRNSISASSSAYKLCWLSALCSYIHTQLDNFPYLRSLDLSGNSSLTVSGQEADTLR